MPNLPVPYRDPSLVRAAASPTAGALTAAGVVVGLLLIHSVLLAVILGAAAWSGRMVAALIARNRRLRAGTPRPAALDPWSVPEPWRQLVRQAMDAQSRFDQAVGQWPAGPIRDRLSGIEPRVWANVEQIGALARRGAAWSNPAGPLPSGASSADQLTSQLRSVQAELSRLDGGSARGASLARTEEALAAQLRAAHQVKEAEAALEDKLRMLVARLDQTVTSLLLVGLGDGQTGADALLASLDGIDEEIVSLGQGLEETSRTALESATSGEAFGALPGVPPAPSAGTDRGPQAPTPPQTS